jgi:hypothetical protein|tara:strand:+ start:211 stop:459 length:249 start_codon:yes stop_codon:yes gene_type:complete
MNNKMVFSNRRHSEQTSLPASAPVGEVELWPSYGKQLHVTDKINLCVKNPFADNSLTLQSLKKKKHLEYLEESKKKKLRIKA